VRFVAIVVVMATVAWLASHELGAQRSAAPTAGQARGVVDDAKRALGDAQATAQSQQDARTGAASQP
jgi:hypothetical protein